MSRRRGVASPQTGVRRSVVPIKGVRARIRLKVFGASALLLALTGLFVLRGRTTTRSRAETPRFPDFSRGADAGGKRIINVDAQVLAAFCRATMLPEPPEPDATDADTYELMLTAMRAAGERGAGDDVGRLGQIYHGNGFADRALACYRRAATLAPTDASWWHLMGLVQMDAGDSTGAIESLRQAVRHRSDDAAGLARLGGLLAARGDLDEACACLHKYVELRPADTTGHYALGKLAFDRAAYAEAAAHLRTAIEHDPRHQSAHYLFGRTLDRLGDRDAARESFAASAALPNDSTPLVDDPIRDEMFTVSRSTTALQEHMTQYWKAGRTDEAYKVALEVIARRPADFVMLRNAGLLARQTHQPAEAVRFLERCIEVNPSYLLGHTTLSEILRDQNRLDESLAAVDRAIGIDPEDGTARLVRGGIELRLKRYAEALVDLDRGLSRMPDHGNGHAMRATALIGLGRIDEARPALERAAVLMPGNAWVQQQLEAFARATASQPAG